MKVTFTCQHGARAVAYAKEVEGPLYRGARDPRLKLKEPVVRRLRKACAACRSFVDSAAVVDLSGRAWIHAGMLLTGATLWMLKTPPAPKESSASSAKG